MGLACQRGWGLSGAEELVNEAVRGLHELLGYRVVRRLPGYNGDEDGLLMEKEVG